jgi:hypothetical protein
MSCQKRISVAGLALFLLAFGTSLECRADGNGIAPPRAVSASQNISVLCALDLEPCVSAVRSPQATAHHSMRQGSNKHGSSSLALGTNDANAANRQHPDRTVSALEANFIVASMGAGKNTDKGRLALNMMLDGRHHGAILNPQTPFEAMQVSLSYSRTW